MPNTDPSPTPVGAASAVAMLHAEGYDDAIQVSSAGVWCDGCSCNHPIENMVQERVFRFEGASNPDDMSIVVGIRCRVCGGTGVVVSAYGPSADPALFELLLKMPIELDAHDPPA